MVEKPRVGNYVEFDIRQPSDNDYIQYKSGNIVTINGDDIIINQKEDVYDGISHSVNQQKVRNWKIDMKNKSMVI